MRGSLLRENWGVYLRGTARLARGLSKLGSCGQCGSVGNGGCSERILRAPDDWDEGVWMLVRAHLPTVVTSVLAKKSAEAKSHAGSDALAGPEALASAARPSRPAASTRSTKASRA